MCGIIGYTGSLQAKDVLIRGLKRMEYRGYDSAGIAVEQAAVRLDAEERAAGREAVDPQLFAGICVDLEREGFFRQEDGRLFP